MANFVIKNNAGGDVGLELDRSTNTDWRLLASSGNLYIQHKSSNTWSTSLLLNEASQSNGLISTSYKIQAAEFLGNASTATKLATPRTISLTGAITGSGSFDGSKDLSIATSINHNHNLITYPAQLTTDDGINNFNAANTFQVTTWTSTSSPGVSNGIIISTGWTSTSYGAQIAIDDDPTYYIALRQKGTSGWSAWKRIPMGDGTGASGTWGISISGTSTAVKDYNSNTPTYFGYSTAEMESANWIAAWDATVSGQYRLRAIQPSKLSVAYAQNSNQLDNIDSSGFARRYALGGLGDYQVAVIGLFPVATADNTGSAHHVSGRITANRTNGLYASPFIDFCMNDSYHTGNKFNVSYNGQNIGAFIPCTFIYEGVRYAGFKFAPGNAQCASVTFIGQTTYTPFMIAYYHNNNGVINSEINNSINTSHAIINGQTYAGGVYGAVWNDYAEYRNTTDAKPGEVIIENGDGSLHKSIQRLEPGANIVTDTFGFAIGETNQTKTPIAVAGRVLAYPYENRYSYKPGAAVCSAPDGKVSQMTREEMINYPDCIIGFVSEIPEYETWGSGNVKVNGRIWIKIK